MKNLIGRTVVSPKHKVTIWRILNGDMFILNPKVKFNFPEASVLQEAEYDIVEYHIPYQLDRYISVKR